MRLFSKYFQLSVIAFLMGCAVARADMGKIESISLKQASAMYTEKKAVILDVREDSEWAQQHIPGAIHIPLAQLNERLSELKQYRDSPLITQCRTGGRSGQALDVLKSAGFTKVYNMDGGIVAWDKAGLKTE